MGGMNCPKCKQELSADGQLEVDGQTMAVYQCIDCTRTWEFDGETFEFALTFAIDNAGKMYDPETLTPLHLN